MFRNWTVTLLAHPSPPSNALDALAAHSSTLVLEILVSSPPATSLTAVLAHLSTVANTVSLAPQHAYIRILTPSALTVYILAFLTPTASTLSPLCSVLATYKITFEATLTNPSAASTPTGTPLAAGSSQPSFPSASQPHPQSQTPSQPTAPAPPYPRPYVNEFNGFLMDICNLLWRSRAFNTTDQNALGCRVPAATTRALAVYLETTPQTAPSQQSQPPQTPTQTPPLSLAALFGFSFHPALAALGIAAFREVEDRAIEAGSGSGSAAGSARRGAAEGTGVAGTGQGTPGEVRIRHAGPVSQRSVAALAAQGGVRLSWAEYRMEVLWWLEARGVAGIGELMYCTMKNLMGVKRRVGGARGSLGGGVPATPV